VCFGKRQKITVSCSKFSQFFIILIKKQRDHKGLCGRSLLLHSTASFLFQYDKLENIKAIENYKTKYKEISVFF
jgi:hypothetical protein